MNTTVVKPRFSLFRLVFAFIGLALLVAGMAWGISSWYFSKDAKSAIGTVTAIDYEGEGNAIRPFFLFRDDVGNPHVAKTNIASSEYDYQIGDKVSILYNFRVSDDVRIEGWVNSWGTGLVAGLIGLFLLGRARRKPAARQIVTADTGPATPWVDASDAESKKALISAIMQTAAGARASNATKVPPKAPVAAVKVRSAPRNTPANQPTVRRMR